MKKLKQLLNEYYPLDTIYQEYHIVNSIVYLRRYGDTNKFNYRDFTLNVISKKFWFIERLVIYAKVKYWPIEELTIIDKDWKMYWYTDTLLMHLAIQDDPISFLVSILK